MDKDIALICNELDNRPDITFIQLSYTSHTCYEKSPIWRRKRSCSISCKELWKMKSQANIKSPGL